MIIKDPLPASSFLSLDKDLNIIINSVFKNKRLTKLLYYNSEDALSCPALEDIEIVNLMGKNIRIVPKMDVNNSILNYLFISFNDFVPNRTNPYYRDNIIEFDILCHYDLWNLKDNQLRPYRIAAEIDSMFNGKHLTGIGTLQFVCATQISETDQFGGLCLVYRAIHGDEDKKPMPNPQDQEQFEKDFYEMMESNE